jgi:hypothetical protein
MGDAEWMVIRGPLLGHNDTPFVRPTPASFSAARDLPPSVCIWWFKLLLISNILFENRPPDREIYLKHVKKNKHVNNEKSFQTEGPFTTDTCVGTEKTG